MLKHTGPAVIFESEIDAYNGIVFGKVKAGDVVVIRYEGPKGGPGHAGDARADDGDQGRRARRQRAPRHRRPILRRHGRRIDRPRQPRGRRRRTDRACCKDGDIIEIDIPNGVLSVRLSEEELADRRAQWSPPKPKFTSSYLARYAKMATSADTGAILKWD